MMLDTEERKRRKEEANRREAAMQQQEDTQPARSLGEFINHLPPLPDDHPCCVVQWTVSGTRTSPSSPAS